MNKNLILFIAKFRNLFFMLTVLVLLTSCMNDDDDPVTQPVEVAYVSIYHAAPDAPDLDIVVDGRVINRNPFDYASYSGYLNFFTGSREISFNAVNANSALVDTTFSFENGKAYSLFAVNQLPDVEAFLVVDSASAPSAGKAMIRFVNLSPDAPAFDISNSDGTTPMFEGKGFKEATEFREIDAATHSFQVKNSGGSDALLTTGDVEILAGRYYTIITRGFVNPPSGNNNALNVEVLE